MLIVSLRIDISFQTQKKTTVKNFSPNTKDNLTTITTNLEGKVPGGILGSKKRIRFPQYMGGSPQYNHIPLKRRERKTFIFLSLFFWSLRIIVNHSWIYAVLYH